MDSSLTLKNQYQMNPKSEKPNGPQFSKALYRDQLITLNDLLQFKQELLFEFRQIIKEISGRPTKQWLKSQEVQKLLGISPGTLQTLRNNRTIPFTKIGGIVYYSCDEIYKMMDKHKLPTR